MILAAPNAPVAALATAMHAGRWADVRAISATFPRPLPPAVALAAARAWRDSGEPARALDALRAAIPNAGALGAALRLEAAEAALTLGQDPSPLLAPLLSRAAPASHRRAATRFLRRAWSELPLEQVRRASRDRLPRPLRRELTAVLAVRSGDAAAALRALEAGGGERSTLGAARFLAQQPSLPPPGAIAVAQALLNGGEWRRSEEVLDATGPPGDPALQQRWAFLRGRAAYRLGELAPAADAFDRALATATCPADRFAAAVQRARVAELQGDLGAASGFWDAARTAAPREVEGWDGGARDRAALGHPDDAWALLRRAPHTVVRVAGPRLAALLLGRDEVPRAREVLAALPARLGAARLLRVVALLRSNEPGPAREEATALLADPHGGAWRELVLDLLPPAASRPAPQASRDPGELARLAATQGADAAREALRQALVGDPAWAPLFGGELPEPASWRGPARDLAEVGLEHEAAALYPQAFPASSPTDLAWSASQLAAWGNQPEALDAGERLWAALDHVPAALLPDPLLPRILPSGLTSACVAAAAAAGVRPSWLVALVRQESRFDRSATSSAGALGIAQFIPEVARQLGADPATLVDADVSLALAAHEASRLEGRYGARLAFAAAAYNAGDAVVASWLGMLGGEPDKALFAAAIPYRETSTYVLAVLEGAALARDLDGAPSTGVVPVAATAPAAARVAPAQPTPSAPPPRR